MAGAPVIVTPTWFLAAAVLTFLFVPTVSNLRPELPDAAVVSVAFAFVLLLFGSVFCHEAAHAVVAKARGQEVTELALTLLGGHTAFTGTATAGSAALIAVVGPLANLALAGLFWLGFQVIPVDILALLCFAAFFSNVFVGLFNLLPGLPLDGGQLLESVVWRATGSRTRGTVAAGRVGRVVALGVAFYAIAWPMLRGFAPQTSTVMWTLIIAMFLWQGATVAIGDARRREAVAGITVASLMRPAVTVPCSAYLPAAITAAATRPGAAIVTLNAAGTPLGWLNPDAVTSVPTATLATTSVQAVLVPFPSGSGVDQRLGGVDLLQRLAASSRGARIIPVTREGQLTGVLDVTVVAAAVRATGAK